MDEPPQVSQKKTMVDNKNPHKQRYLMSSFIKIINGKRNGNKASKL